MVLYSTMADSADPHVRKSNTLFVRNLPPTTSNDKLERLFSDVGPIKQCFVVADKGSGNCKGYGYVKFSLIDDAEVAKEKIKSLDGRKLFISYAERKRENKRRKKKEKISSKEDSKELFTVDKQGSHQQNTKTQASTHSDDSSDDDDNDDDNFEHGDQKVSTRKVVDKEKISKERQERKYLNSKTLLVTGWTEVTDQSKVQEVIDKMKVRNVSRLEFPMKNREVPTALIRFKSIRDTKRGLNKLQGKDVKGCSLRAVQMSKDTQTVLDHIPQTQLKKCRLIIRNLSFKCNEDNLREVFEKFGLLTEVKTPRTPDGKTRGFGFVQFTNMRDASRAVSEMNTRSILGRPVAVDWAVPKDKFTSTNQANKASMEEPKLKEDESKSHTSEEESDSEEDDSMEPPKSSDHQKSRAMESESDKDDEDEDESSDDDDDDKDEEEESSDEGFDEEDEEERDNSPVDLKRKRGNRNLSSDVNEGRTVFIRNISYQTTEETLEAKFSQFGKINYCKVVKDPMTDHSKGTAFIQFQSADAAEQSLQKSNDDSKSGGIVVDHRRLSVIIAVDRNKAKELKNKEKKEKTDKRNLHLVREGMIRPGTQAAQGLTKEDLSKRTKLETVKRQKLKNPNIFVSSTRLSVHNIPVNVDEKHLKKIFLKAVGDRKAVINECRIMRDVARLNNAGVGKSRGFGFINFTDHQHALQALRGTNNNPDLFGEKKRLIVEFSLENKAALEAKDRRIERQKARKEALQKASEDQGKDNSSTSSEKKEVNQKKRKEVKLTDKYIGKPAAVVGDGTKKLPKGLPSHWGPKVRHKPRPQANEGKKKKKQGKKEFKENSFASQVNDKKRKVPQEFADTKRTEKKKRRRQKGQGDNFDKLVNKYKQTLLSSGSKSKWFDA